MINAAGGMAAMFGMDPEDALRHDPRAVSAAVRPHDVQTMPLSDKELAWKAAWQHPFFQGNADKWVARQSSKKLEASFGKEGGVLMCIDEGIEPEEGSDAVYLAGSGVLYHAHSVADLEQRHTQLAEQLRSKHITGVSSHQDCKACAEVCERIGGGDAEQFAIAWSTKLAEKLGVPYVGHLVPKRAAFHNALIAYYDSTGKFEHPTLAGLPPGFIISRGLLENSADAMDELKLAAEIATSEHGYGNRFSANRPFTLCAIPSTENPEFSEQNLLQELSKVAERDPRIRTDILRLPKPKYLTLRG